MKVTNKYIGALLLGLGLAGMQSCSDTWDDHYAPADSDVATSTETLWEIISKDSKLSKFAEVAKKTHYYRDEKHPQADYTYSDMFNGTQLITVWAPTNDALTPEEWQRWNEFAENGMGYTVQQQIMANSIALWRNIANGGGVDTLAMLNGKKVPFDKVNGTIAGLDILDKNIAASNGTLHIVGKPLPFTYNLYEYLKDVQNTRVSKFHDYVLSKDTTYFNEYGSIEGIPDIDGNPTYVDSAYTTSNAMFFGTLSFPANGNNEIYDTYDESFGANIAAEDSSFVMLIPTDAAWEHAFAKLEKYYNYAEIYVDKKKQQEQEVADGSVKDFRNINPDSLKQKCLEMDITSLLCFNVNLQPNAAERLGQWTAETLLDNMAQAPYIVNTYGDTLRTDADWVKESLFIGERVKMSNGYGIISDTWNIPAKLYKPDVIVEIGWGSLYNENLGSGTATPVDFSNEAARASVDSLGVAWIDTTGVVSNNNFYYLKPTNESSSPSFTFKLEGTGSQMENTEAEVMSGKYDVYAVMVPNYYITSTDSIDADPKKHLKHKISATLWYNNGAKNGKDVKAEAKDVEYDGEKVEELLLFEDFEFPFSYKNLRYSYPTLTLTAKSSTADRKNGYSNDFCIDRIILKSKD